MPDTVDPRLPDHTFTDVELAEAAMNAAPFDPFAPDTVPFVGTSDDQAVGLLPSWYMPAPSMRRSRPRVVVFAGLAIALLTVNVGGFCVTYGFPRIRLALNRPPPANVGDDRAIGDDYVRAQLTTRGTNAMSDMNGPDELLAEVLERYSGAPDERMKTVMEAAIRHLHAFAREIDLQRDEWMAGIQFLTATGQMCSDSRQEFILMSDTLGLSTLVEMLSYSPTDGTTENTVLGPFFAPGSPDRALGASMLDDDDAGDRVVVRGTITDPDGTPLPGVVLDCWQSNTQGFYTVQQIDGQSEFNLRGIYRTDDDGRYEIRSVRPGAYPIPHDGPVGALLKDNNRGWMRPGHLHTWVKHPGYKELITHIFDRESDHLYDDAVFGVRESLIVEFTPDEHGELSATFDFVLDPQ